MRIKPLILLLAATVLAVVFFYMLQYQREKRLRIFRQHNIVLVTIDTLRADHLPAYGYKNVKTPAIDKFAAGSLIFEDAIAHTPMTLPSHASILTGLLPIAHGVRDNAGFSLDPRVTTLAERLKEQQYRTAAFVSAFVLDSQFGLAQGFDVYSDEFTLTQGGVSNLDLYRRAEATQKHVDSWLRKNKDQKFFLWVHYYDPHDPYEPPEPFSKEYRSSLYDGEIAYTDQAFGKLQDTLQELGLTDKTIVVLTGDHGEGLGEHNERTHSLFIYNATQHVPLLIHLPGGKSRRIEKTVSHIDLVPTLLEWLGLSADPQLQGRSLIPMLQSTQQLARAAYSESLFPELHYGWSPLRSITTSSHKFIEAPSPELYDRKMDRAETRNIFRQQPQVAESLRKQINDIVASQSIAAETATRKVDPETEEKLKALGYVGTTVASTPESRKIDPKDKVKLLEALSKAGREMEAGNYALVLEAVQPVLEEEPANVDAHFMKATALLHLQKPEQALPEMLETIRLKPDHSQTLYNLAFLHQLQGRLEDAEHYYRLLLKYEPEHLFGNLNLAGIYLKQDARQRQNLISPGL